MLVVIAILSVLTGAGISLLGGTGQQARKAGADMISGMVDQARSLAINSRSNVYLVIAEPGTLPAQDERYQVALIREVKPPTGAPVPLPGQPSQPSYELVRRWQTLNTGVVLLKGKVGDLENALDGVKQDFTYTSNKKQLTAKLYKLGINSLGSLNRSNPVILRLAEGAYRNGEPIAKKVEGGTGIAETQLKVGKVIARAFRAN